MAPPPNDRCIEHEAAIRDQQQSITELKRVVFGEYDEPGLKGKVNEMWRWFMRAENNRTVAVTNIVMAALNFIGLLVLAIILHKFGIGGLP